MRIFYCDLLVLRSPSRGKTFDLPTTGERNSRSIPFEFFLMSDNRTHSKIRGRPPGIRQESLRSRRMANSSHPLHPFPNVRCRGRSESSLRELIVDRSQLGPQNHFGLGGCRDASNRPFNERHYRRRFPPRISDSPLRYSRLTIEKEKSDTECAGGTPPDGGRQSVAQDRFSQIRVGREGQKRRIGRVRTNRRRSMRY